MFSERLARKSANAFLGRRSRLDRILGRTPELTGSPIRLRYFVRVPNVGDLINPTLVSVTSGRPTRWHEDRELPHLLAVGSMLRAATERTHVWGTGLMSPDVDGDSLRAPNLHALRGRLTLEAVRQSGVPIPDIPLGDPGYLLPELLGIRADRERTYEVGLVAHYVDRDHPVVQRLLQNPDVLDLNVHQDADAFLRAMAQCKTVVSSSLHGLVFAEALGIPNLWVTATGKVAGSGFKFNDWFSTTDRPQEKPVQLTAKSRARKLAARAETHESQIDRRELLSAFPFERIDELSEGPVSRVHGVRRCRQRPVPVFLISFNRGTQLRSMVEGLRRLETPTEIIVHDNGSSDPATLEILAELERDGVRVARCEAISSPDELNLVDATVQRYFADWSEPQRYVVSDCDIDLTVADPRALDVYGELLNRHPDAECVGPMLRISDLPAAYPLRNNVLNKHIFQFWQHEPRIEKTPFGDVAFRPARIDTTLAMHRAGEPFRRLKMGLRVYEPFEARHMDWYEWSSPAYGESASAEITNWGRARAEDTQELEPLRFSSFTAVRAVEQGRLEPFTVHL